MMPAVAAIRGSGMTAIVSGGGEGSKMTVMTSRVG